MRGTADPTIHHSARNITSTYKLPDYMLCPCTRRIMLGKQSQAVGEFELLFWRASCIRILALAKACPCVLRVVRWWLLVQEVNVVLTWWVPQSSDMAGSFFAITTLGLPEPLRSGNIITTGYCFHHIPIEVYIQSFDRFLLGVTVSSI